MKYFVYCRKSTEDEERQALSLSTQLDKACEMFGDLDLIELPPESASAFYPNNRPIFAEMLARIAKGEASGIIAWHPDRLSRNSKDAGEFVHLVQAGVIKDLKFGSYYFDNSPEGIMMLQLAMSQSQYSSAKLSKDVKRGNEQKLKLGWKPGWAPTGYLNTPDMMKGTKIIIEDPDRFELVQKAWHLMLTGRFTVPEILNIMTDDWGFRTRRVRKIGGTPLSRSALYGIFTNPFYAGKIRYNGELHDGAHSPMISLGEFDQVQRILGRNGKPRPQVHKFMLRGLMECGECGCMITAEIKQKFVKSEQLTRDYIYYHCTKKRPCRQRGVASEPEIIRQVDEYLAGMTIMPEFRDWALESLREHHEQEVSERATIQRSQSNALLSAQKRLDKLMDMRLGELISDEEYVAQKERLATDVQQLKEQLRDTETRGEKWFELAEQAFDLATNAKAIFNSGAEDEKRQVFQAIGSRVSLKNKRLTFEAHPWLVPIQEKYPAIERALEEVRTDRNADSKKKKAALAAVRSQWLPGPDSNRQPRS